MSNKPLVERLIEYELGLSTPEETLLLFQYLVDTGLAWSLQGGYGREAKRLIEAGEIDSLHITKARD